MGEGWESCRVSAVTDDRDAIRQDVGIRDVLMELGVCGHPQRGRSVKPDICRELKPRGRATTPMRPRRHGPSGLA